MIYPFSYTVEIFEYDHFEKHYEDIRNNLVILHILDEIEEWINKNIPGGYEIDCEEYYKYDTDFVRICFNTATEASLFRMRWCKPAIPYYPEMFEVNLGTIHKRNSIEIFNWLKENIGENGIAWKKKYYDHIFSFYTKSDATLFKVRWG